MKPEIPEPETFDEKEIYAYFGLAGYHAQVLEKGLVNMVTVYKTYGLPISQSQFDAIFANYDSRTIGQLLTAARKHGIPIPDASIKLLDEALKKRNYLNHDFFADHAGHWTTLETRKVMIDRLCLLIRLFEKADEASEHVYRPLMEKMRVTEEEMEEHRRKIFENAFADVDK